VFKLENIKFVFIASVFLTIVFPGLAFSQDCNSNGVDDSVDLSSLDYSVSLNAMSTIPVATASLVDFTEEYTTVLGSGAQLTVGTTLETTNLQGRIQRIALTPEAFDNIVVDPDCASLICLGGVGQQRSSVFLNQVVEADVNNDGQMDLVTLYSESFNNRISPIGPGVAARQDSLLLLLNRGDDSFQVKRIELATAFLGLTGIELSDYNADGVLDILITDDSSGTNPVSTLYDGALSTFSLDTNSNSIPDECEFDPEVSFAAYNSFLGMSNILEIVNSGLNDTTGAIPTSPGNSLIDLTAFPRTGSATFNQPVAFDLALNQLDVIHNDFLGIGADDFGYSRLNFDGSATARNMFYRFSPSGEIDYFFPSTFRRPNRGETAVTLNSFDPNAVINPAERAGFEVENILTIYNLTDNFQGYDVSVRNLDGKHASMETFNPEMRIVLPPREAGFIITNQSFFGVAVVVPDDKSHDYLAELTRYNPPSPGSDDFPYAFALPFQPPSVTERVISISRGGGATNWVELANPTDSSIQVAYQVYGNDGSLLAGNTVALDPFSQMHFNASDFLLNGDSISGQMVFTPVESYDRFLVGGISYFSPCANCEVTGAFVNEAVAPFATDTTVSYNSFLGFNNFLRLSNTTASPQTYDVRLDSEVRSYTLDPFASIDIGFIPGVSSGGLLFEVPTDTYGKVSIEPLGGGEYIAQMLRLKLDENSNFIAAAAFQAE